MTAKLPAIETNCGKCGKLKHPTKAYVRFCQAAGEPWICKACRESMPPPPIKLGKLGWLA